MTQITLREYLRTIEDAISSGRINEAMTNCQNILSYFPEALEALRLLGEVYLAQGQLEEAQKTFEWILTNDPENVIAYCDRALISERLSDIDTALDCYQQAYELSRGNANIRQEFNQLSARAGQQEFMFSRAGLARLYMRGNLLTQAIQEWEAVLAISPDRLDARLGLIETYWREGLFDKAEQLATRLLDEIPTCLKALLYLAHTTSISSITRAKDLLQRAETLDPELCTAQEIFADLAASQPHDPFLALLKKEPILLEDGVPVNVPIARAPVEQPVPVQQAASVASTDWNMPSPISPLPQGPSSSTDWRGISQDQPESRTWQEQLMSPTPAEQPWYESDQYVTANAAGQPSWEAQSDSTSDPHDWNNDVQEEEQPAPPAWLDTLTRSEQPPVATPAYHAPSVVPPTEAEVHAVAQPPTPQEDEDMPFFLPSDTTDNDNEMGWPAWLKSLGAESLEPEAESLESETISEELAPSEPTLTPITRKDPYAQMSEHEADPWAAQPTKNTTQASQPETANQLDWMQQLAAPTNEPAHDAAPDWMQQFSTPTNEVAQSTTPDWMQQFSTPINETAQSSTPDWMQQLATPTNEPAHDAAPDWMQQFSTPTNEVAQSATPDWMQQLTGPVATSESAQDSTPDWMQQFASAESVPVAQPITPVPLPIDEQEQNYITSLENLEKSLQAQGFAPLTPGTLASLAQASAETPSQPQEQPSLSSALAQLGNFTQPPMAQVAASAAGEPWWNTMLSQTPEQPLPTPAVALTPNEQITPLAAVSTRTVQEAVPPLPTLPATPTPIPPTAMQPSVSPHPTISAPLTPAYRSDALLDSELETTMKRPAIKLQPMQASPSPAIERVAPNGKDQKSERPIIEQRGESTLNQHERLVRGYQYQLSGAYDEAMNDYRQIIRNAPELLDDVISNMRALLKLNPRFSQGYRVLGDAYMRKGEYLQAMEAYNKALTMAKKSQKLT